MARSKLTKLELEILLLAAGAVALAVPITPGMQGKLRVKRSEELTDLLNLKSYESCDADNRNPILMLMEVRFEDGSVWHPYARAF